MDVVRIGLCQPLDVVSYDIIMDYPGVIRKTNSSKIFVNSLEEVDSDTTGQAFYHDRTRGWLFSVFIFKTEYVQFNKVYSAYVSSIFFL